ncbi:MAG: M3 family metallopeptidase, partial [Ignavibacteria bacterium]|nr:M3 family metallopeptidase [Ignavibacteria bacterium]
MCIRDRFYRYDVPFILRNNRFDKYFKKDSLISIWKSSLASMGILIDSLKNIHLDLEDRQNKNPRAACFPINIPDDIRMSVKPIGGFDDYSALFHESGHSLHYGLTKESALEYTYLGDNTVTETYAFLFEHLLDEPNWLRTNLKMKETEIKNFIKFRAFQRLYMVRRYCAKFLYELQLYDTLITAPQKYDELLSSTLGYKSTTSDKKLYLDDVDPFFYVVDYLRAWFIEAMFKTKLRELFGDDWYMNNSIKDYLSDFFQYGQKFTIDEFIQKIGFTDLDPKFLANEINEMRTFSRKK